MIWQEIRYFWIGALKLFMLKGWGEFSYPIICQMNILMKTQFDPFKG